MIDSSSPRLDDKNTSIDIIDFHVHMAVESQGMWTPGVWDLVHEYYPDKYKDIQRYGDNPSLFRKYLESQEIKNCVLLAEDSVHTGLVPNDYILDYCSQEPGFFIPFLAMNPNKTLSFKTNRSRFQKSVEFCCHQLEWFAELGFKGIKDYGSYNLFPPGTRLMFPFYHKAAELNLPMLFHTGESIFDSPETRKLADPVYLEPIASELPQLKIVIAHCGGGKYFHKSYELARKYHNVFLEFSGVPPHLVKRFFFDRNLDLNTIPDKLVFGSDYPALPNGPNGIRKNIQTYKQLAEQGILGKDTLRGLLGMNAIRILSLEPIP